MTEFLGFNFPTPDITGMLSSSWIYVAIISFIIVIAFIILAIVLFFMTYNVKVEVYDNIGGGKKMTRIIKTRARKVKVGPGGEELLHLLRPRVFRTAYGKKIDVNTYAFAVGPDGYWYNINMADLDTKLGILDVEPIDRDMRMMTVAVEKIINENYNPNKNMIIGMSIFAVVMVLIMLVGTYLIVGKTGTIAKDFQIAVDKFASVAETQAETTAIIANAKLKNENLIDTPPGLILAIPGT